MKKILILSLLMISLMSSCGSPHAKVLVRNNAENTQTTIDVKTGDGGSTSVTVSPSMNVDSVNLQFGPKSN